MKDYSKKAFEKSVTIFYGKKTGEIKETAGGIQDLGYYGPQAGDNNYDFIVLEKTPEVLMALNNIQHFKVKNGKLVLKSDLFNSFEIDK